MENLKTTLGVLSAIFAVILFVILFVNSMFDYRKPFTKRAVNGSIIVCIVLAMSYFSTWYFISYNSITNKIIRNIENNPKNWTYGYDTSKLKEFEKRNFTKLNADLEAHFLSLHCNEILTNVNCGIKIECYNWYNTQATLTMFEPTEHSFNTTESNEILEAYDKVVLKPKREYANRLMEPIRLVAQWKEEARQDSISKILDNCK